MSKGKFKAYDVDDYVAEIYDQTETQTEDVALLRKQIDSSTQLHIFEPFCGNGRISIPLAEGGHHIVGMDQSHRMLSSAKQKIQKLSREIQARIKLAHGDVTKDPWPTEIDLVILGANCFYELPTAEMQEHCIRRARQSLNVGGHLYLDNDHMERELAEDWQDPGIVHENRFPTGQCADGTQVKGSMETVWFDAPNRLVRFRRTVEIRTTDGELRKKEWEEQKHPPSTGEMRSWLEKHDFEVECLWGDRNQASYTDGSDRAIFWARLCSKGQRCC